MRSIILIGLLLPLMAFAEEVGPIPVIDQISAFLMSPPGYVGVIAALVIEMLMRVIKTEKPWSIAHLVAKGAHQIAALIKALAVFLDSVLPQNLKK
jgi:hypothetical protein